MRSREYLLKYLEVVNVLFTGNNQYKTFLNFIKGLELNVCSYERLHF